MQIDSAIGLYTILLSFIDWKHFSHSTLIVDYGGNYSIFVMSFVLHQIPIVGSLVHDMELFKKQKFSYANLKG